MLGVIATIPVGLNPTEVVVSPGGDRAYVVNAHGASVSVIDTVQDIVTDAIALNHQGGGKVALAGAAVSPDGGHLYVVGSESAPIPPVGSPPGQGHLKVWVIDTAALAVADNYPFADIAGFGGELSVVIHPDGTRLYLGNSGTLSVKVLDIGTKTISASIDTQSLTARLAISPDGKHVYAANGVDASVSVIDTTSHSVATVGFHPYPPDNITYYSWGVAVSPDGKQVFAANVPAFHGSSPCSVFVIDTATNVVTGFPIPVGSFPGGVAVSPDGASVYVTGANDASLTEIDTAAGQVISPIEYVGQGPAQLAVSPDGARAYVPNSADNTVSVLKQVPPPLLPQGTWPDDLVGKLIGGLAQGGGGWLVVGAHAYKIPPRPLAVAAIARAAAPYLSAPIENAGVSEQLRNML